MAFQKIAPAKRQGRKPNSGVVTVYPGGRDRVLINVSADVASGAELFAGGRCDVLAGTGDDAGKFGVVSSRRGIFKVGKSGACARLSISKTAIGINQPAGATHLPWFMDGSMLVIDARALTHRAPQLVAA